MDEVKSKEIHDVFGRNTIKDVRFIAYEEKELNQNCMGINTNPLLDMG